MKKIEAIIFDLDGTLIRSGPDLAKSVNYALARVGLPERLLAEIEGFVGDGVDKLIERALGKEQLEKFPETLELFMAHYEEHCTDATVTYSGVTEMLERLFGEYRLAVLTNKSFKFSMKILGRLNISHYFDYVVGGDSLAAKKPAPTGIFHLAEKWGIEAGRILMVGDHATDIETGINAGCATVFFSGGIGETRGLRPDATIHSMAELPELLKKRLD